MSQDRQAVSVDDSLPTIQVDGLEGRRLERTVIGAYVGANPGIVVEAGADDAETVEARLDAVLDRLPGARLDRATTPIRVRFETDPIPDPFQVVADIHGDAQSLLAIADRSISQKLGPADQDHRETVEERCDGRLFHLLREERRGADWSIVDGRAAVGAAQRLERIADYAYGVSVRAQEMGPQERVGVIGERIRQAIDEVQRLVVDAHHAVQRPDLNLGQEVVEDIDAWSQQLEEEAVSMASSPREPDQLPSIRLYRGYFSLLEDTQRIGLYAKSIAESGIDRACCQAEGPEETIRIGAE